MTAASLVPLAGCHDIGPYPESEIPYDRKAYWLFLELDLH
jgi:hypothetical protein